ncbi:hypothetical protein C0J52_23499 [Blattella germanica]|nr:hypothetical protein C0J52_23499 [Blattella germanica]
MGWLKTYLVISLNVAYITWYVLKFPDFTLLGMFFFGFLYVLISYYTHIVVWNDHPPLNYQGRQRRAILRRIGAQE